MRPLTGKYGADLSLSRTDTNDDGFLRSVSCPGVPAASVLDDIVVNQRSSCRKWLLDLLEEKSSICARRSGKAAGEASFTIRSDMSSCEDCWNCWMVLQYGYPRRAFIHSLLSITQNDSKPSRLAKSSSSSQQNGVVIPRRHSIGLDSARHLKNGGFASYTY